MLRFGVGHRKSFPEPNSSIVEPERQVFYREFSPCKVCGAALLFDGHPSMAHYPNFRWLCLQPPEDAGQRDFFVDQTARNATMRRLPGREAGRRRRAAMPRGIKRPRDRLLTTRTLILSLMFLSSRIEPKVRAWNGHLGCDKLPARDYAPSGRCGAAVARFPYQKNPQGALKGLGVVPSTSRSR